MFRKPVEGWSKLIEAKFFGRGAQSREGGVEGKTVARDAGLLDALGEAIDGQTVQTRLRLVPEPQHISPDTRKLAEKTQRLPDTLYAQPFKFRPERMSRHAFHD